MARPQSENKLEKIELQLPPEIRQWFDEWWRKQGFASRNEAMRHLILEKKWKENGGA